MRRCIPVEEVFEAWRKDPAFMAAHDALESEFALASALIGARAHADLSQEELARRMSTTKAVIVRLEGGRMTPTTRTLERYAKATGSRLRISFEPDPAQP